ncbi:MAG: hypothetical protein Q9216_005587 [Gyalolechia sp. 2 TL-2023]
MANIPEEKKYYGPITPTQLLHRITCTRFIVPERDERNFMRANARLWQVISASMSTTHQITLCFDFSNQLVIQNFDEQRAYLRPTTSERTWTGFLRAEPGGQSYALPKRLVFRLLVAAFQAGIAQAVLPVEPMRNDLRVLSFDWNQVEQFLRLEEWEPPRYE